MTSQFIKSTLAMEHHQINKMMAEREGVEVALVDNGLNQHFVTGMRKGEEVEYNPCCDLAKQRLMISEHRLAVMWVGDMACVNNNGTIVQHKCLGKAICVAVLCGGA